MTNLTAILVAAVVAMGIPTALTGFCVWNLERKITERDRLRADEVDRHERDQAHKEEIQRKNSLLIIKGVRASIALGEATATALKNGHTNGETDAALNYAREVKHEQNDFLTAQGVENIL